MCFQIKDDYLCDWNGRLFTDIEPQEKYDFFNEIFEQLDRFEEQIKSKSNNGVYADSIHGGWSVELKIRLVEQPLKKGKSEEST